MGTELSGGRVLVVVGPALRSKHPAVSSQAMPVAASTPNEAPVVLITRKYTFPGRDAKVVHLRPGRGRSERN
jgi:hypothetical protein